MDKVDISPFVTHADHFLKKPADRFGKTHILATEIKRTEASARSFPVIESSPGNSRITINPNVTNDYFSPAVPQLKNLTGFGSGYGSQLRRSHWYKTNN